MLEGTVCAVCRAGKLVLDSGILVCDVCGSAVQEFAEETQEFQFGISNSQFLRRERIPSQSQQPVVVAELGRPDISGGLKAYVEAVQNILKRQLTTLCRELHAPAEVVDLGAQIWHAYLPCTGLLEPDHVRALEEKIFQSKRGNASARFGEFSKAKAEVADELWAVLPLSVTLSICLLACCCARDAICPLDISHAALDGQLPYLTFAQDSKELLLPFRAVLPQGFLSSSGVPSPVDIYFTSINISTAIGLARPSINAQLWLHRFVTELKLPEELIPVACTLYDLHAQAFPELRDSGGRGSVHPWAFAMAFVVVSARIYCKFDNKKSETDRKCLVWTEWAREHLLLMPGLSKYPLQMTQALQMNHQEISSYMEYLRQTFFSSYSPPEGFAEFQRILGELASNLKTIPSPEPDALSVSHSDCIMDNEAEYQYFGERSRFTLPGLRPAHAALLAVCSFRAWIAPSTLSETVAKIERIMLEAECRVAHRHNQTAQAQLHDVQKMASRNL